MKVREQVRSLSLAILVGVPAAACRAFLLKQRLPGNCLAQLVVGRRHRALSLCRALVVVLVTLYIATIPWPHRRVGGCVARLPTQHSHQSARGSIGTCSGASGAAGGALTKWPGGFCGTHQRGRLQGVTSGGGRAYPAHLRSDA